MNSRALPLVAGCSLALLTACVGPIASPSPASPVPTSTTPTAVATPSPDASTTPDPHPETTEPELTPEATDTPTEPPLPTEVPTPLTSVTHAGKAAADPAQADAALREYLGMRATYDNQRAWYRLVPAQQKVCSAEAFVMFAEGADFQAPALGKLATSAWKDAIAVPGTKTTYPGLVLTYALKSGGTTTINAYQIGTGFGWALTAKDVKMCSEVM